MKIWGRRQMLAGLLILHASTAGAEVVQSFSLEVPAAPSIADVAGKRELVYELHLTNFASSPILIDRITVLDQATGGVLASIEGDKLIRSLGRAGINGSDNVQLANPGARTVAYFNISIESTVPMAVTHRVEFHFASAGGETEARVVGGTARVDPRSPLVLGPPLQGGPWAAVYAPEMERGHRRVIYATNGAAHIPGRFAIDWMRLDEAGRMAPPGARRLDAFFGHGADVLAVADAVVADVRDDVTEAETLDAIPRVSIGDASGNYVVLDLGDGRYAFYEHLQRGVRVKPGQQVRRGDVIGRVGLTGQGSSPHLHFHVANGNSLLDAEGVPFRLEGIQVLGAYPSVEAFDRGGPWAPMENRNFEGPMTPAPNMVVRFEKSLR
jgi:Peptidase family M23